MEKGGLPVFRCYFQMLVDTRKLVSYLGKYDFYSKIVVPIDYLIEQGFSTLATWAPGGMQKVPGGTQKVPSYVNYITEVCKLGTVNYDIGGTQTKKIIGWGTWKVIRVCWGFADEKGWEALL